jgi:diguanylate cyclase (GGDEF)-like protein
VLLWDAEGKLRYANPGAERLFDGRLRDGNLVRYDEPGWGLQREDGEPLGSAEHPVARVLARAEPRIGDVYAVTAADGSKRWISFNAQPLLGSDGQTLMGAVTSRIDVTQLKTREHRLAHLAGHDPLTELPNRRLLAERLRQLTVQARRSGRRVAVCYLDLDGFKPVNDSLGHDAGDELLTEVAQRLLGQVREGDTVARVGGGEFALVLADLTEAQAVGSVLARLLEAISAPYVVAGTLRAGVSASIGVTVFPDDDAEPETLLRHADMAMFVAKQAGKGCYRLYDTTYGRRLSA